MKRLGHRKIMQIANEIRAECNNLTVAERKRLHKYAMKIINSGKK